MTHIFISYAKKDTRELALRLRDALKPLPGITIWVDESLRPGKYWAVQIQEEIRRCDAVVVLLSPDVNRDPTGKQGISFVINEIVYAQRLHKHIIPIMALPTDPPVQLAAMQYIDLTHNEHEGIWQLLAEVSDLASHQPAQTSVNPDIGIPLEKSTGDHLVANATIFSAIIVGLLGILAVIVGVILPPIFQSTNNLTPVISTVDNAPLAIATLSLSPTIDAVAAVRATNTVNAVMTATMNAAQTIVYREDIWELALQGVERNAEWTSFEQNFDGTIMVLVPVGCFTMGSIDGDNNEQPIEKQCLSKPFWIDKTEVTNAAYGSLGCSDYSSQPDQPRNCVTWYAANSYCETRGIGVRLPTELEWEYAARGPDRLRFPWGDSFSSVKVVYAENSNNHTSNVGNRLSGASWVGALDMSGNLWEWVSSMYWRYPYRADDGRENMNITDLRVLRGGSWASYEIDALRAATRSRGKANVTYNGRGFRCARSFE